MTVANPGATLSGTVTLTATPTDAESGVASVTIQRSPAGLNTWTDICVVERRRPGLPLRHDAVGDGLYDLRAIAVDAAGNTKTSATLAGRRVDNTTISTVSLDDPARSCAPR